MATAEEAARFVRRNWHTQEVDDDTLRIIIVWDEGRSQQVYVRTEESHMHFFSPFAIEGDSDPLNILEVADKYVLGIAKKGDYFVVKHMIPLENVDESEINEGVQVVSYVADELEKELLGADNF